MLRKVIGQVFAHESRLGKDNRLGRRRCLNLDHRRLSQWVDFLQLRRRKHVGHALEHFDFQLDILAFLDQPYEALGAGLVQPVQIAQIVSIAIEIEAVARFAADSRECSSPVKRDGVLRSFRHVKILLRD